MKKMEMPPAHTYLLICLLKEFVFALSWLCLLWKPVPKSSATLPPVFFFFSPFSLFFSFVFLPKKTPFPKVSTCCAIHHLSQSGAPTTTMALVTCSATCLQQLASRSWSSSPPLQEVVVYNILLSLAPVVFFLLFLINSYLHTTVI